MLVLDSCPCLSVRNVQKVALSSDDDLMLLRGSQGNRDVNDVKYVYMYNFDQKVNFSTYFRCISFIYSEVMLDQ